MASFVAKFIRKCQIIENSVFHLKKKKKKRQKKNKPKPKIQREISGNCQKVLYFDIAAKKKILIFPAIKEFVILEVQPYFQIIN